MTRQFETIVRQHKKAIISDTEIANLLSGGANSRYALVKRALASKDLIRLRRGLYLLAPHFHFPQPHPFEIAQRIYGPSYISLESALSYHQLIPEAVYSITSVSIKRRKEFQTPIGFFTYMPLPLKNFYTGVNRVIISGSQFFIANPWKALCDYVYCYKKNWRGINPLVESLRIELMDLPALTEDLVENFSEYYKSKRVDEFVHSVLKEIDHDH